MNKDKILVGKIVGAQGLRGELRVNTFTGDPSDIKNMKIEVGETTLQFIRKAGANVAIAKIEGIDDRTAAEKLRGTELFADRAEFPKLEPGEHYVADLIGMRVIAGTGFVSSVTAIHNFGAGDILELDNGDMISFNGAAVDYEKKEIKYA